MISIIKMNLTMYLSVLFVSSIYLCHAEVFTAIADIEYLLETHQRIIDDLDVYVQNEERRIADLKTQLNYYKQEHDIAMKDIPNYLGNPINAFTLIKRLTTDLDNIEITIKKGTEYIKNITMSHPDLKYPTLEDLTGAAQALTRLQETYNLDIRDLSDGKLNGVSYSTPLSAGDCYELGVALYNQKDFKNAFQWILEALRKYDEENKAYYFDKVSLYEYLAFSKYLIGDVKSALEWTISLLAIDPNHARAKGNIPHYEKMIADQEAELKKNQRGDTGDTIITHDYSAPESALPTKERKAYALLCRGEMDIPKEVSRRLKCRYLTENHPFLKLAPIKTEQVYISPDIYLFYDVISDDEISFIKDMARPRFKRAVVHDPKSGNLVSAQYRISKSAWLKDQEHDLVHRISRRVADMTGLDMTTAEELQVVNYGIGGHYEPHFDFARRRERENAFTNYPGNRIATVLFYMSEVAQGGATVFTELGLSLFPVKSAAAFWLNLHPSGEGDLATRHAACPVLRGSKWVSNKWIHQGGQELLKPCSLEFQDESILHPILKPTLKSQR